MASKKKQLHYPFHKQLLEAHSTSDVAKGCEIFDQYQNQMTKLHLNLFLSILVNSSDPGEVVKYRTRVQEIYDQKNYRHEQNTYALMIKLCCLSSELEEAKKLLERAKVTGLQISLRMIRPIIEVIAKNYASIEEVFGFHQEYQKILTEYEEFLFLKYFFLIDKRLNFKDSSNQKESKDWEIISKKDSMVQTSMAWTGIGQILSAFEKNETIISSLTLRLIQQIYPNYTAKVFNAETLVNGYCHHCGNRLQQIDLTSFEKKQLVDNFVAKYRKTRGIKQFHSALSQNPFFSKRIADSNPLYIIDGGNIGYYGQKDYSDYQIQMMIDYLKKLSPKASFLVVIRISHIEIRQEKIKQKGHREFVEDPAKTKKRQDKLERSHKYIEQWEKRKDIYLHKTPLGINDDYFWILAGLYLENAYVVTNDQMRDHHLGVFDDRGAFFRWRSKYVINYDFKRRPNKNPLLQIILPPPFTPCFQRIVSDEEDGFHTPYYDVDRTISLVNLENVDVTPDDFKELHRHEGELVVDWKTLQWVCMQ